MKILRRYQLDIIFLFFALAAILWLAFFVLQELGSDPGKYEWFMAGPFIALYAAYLSHIRSKINLADRRRLTAKTLLYWVVLGIIIAGNYAAPLSAREYWSLNVLFVVFTLFLADSYWDFTTIKWSSIYNKQEIEGKN